MYNVRRTKKRSTSGAEMRAATVVVMEPVRAPGECADGRGVQTKSPQSPEKIKTSM